jgi:hypothetical protein
MALTHIKLTIKGLFAFILLTLLPNLMPALTFTSQGGGGLWALPTSWNQGVLIPGAGDNVIITAGNPITISLPVTVANVSINASSTLLNNSTANITGVLTFTNATSTWTQGAGSTLTLNKTISIPSGFGNFDPSGAGNTVIYAGSSNIIEYTNSSYCNVTLSGASKYIIAATMPFTGNFIIGASSTIYGNFSRTITLSGDFTDNNPSVYEYGTSLTMVGAAGVTQNITKSGAANKLVFYNLTVGNAATASVILHNPMNIEGNIAFSAASGTLDVGASNFAITVYGNWTNNGGTFISRSGTVTFLVSSGTNTVGKTTGPESFYNFIKNLSGTLNLISDLNVSHDLTITLGTLGGNTFNLTVGDYWSDHGTFNSGTGTVIFTGNVSNPFIARAAPPETFYNLIKNTAGLINLQSSISVANNLTLSAGKFDVNSGSNNAISVGGNVNISSGVFLPQKGTFTLNGASQQTLSGAGIAFYNLAVNNTGGANFSVAGYSVTNNCTFNGTGAQLFDGVGCSFLNLTSSTAAGAIFNSGTYTISKFMTSSAGVLGQAGTASVTLTSTALSTAYIGSGAGSYSGTIILQRYITGRTAHWQDFSTPVSNSTLNDWDNEMYMSGVGGPDGTACCPTFYSVNTWSEPTEALVNVTSEVALSPLVGYQIWTADDINNWNAKSIDTRGTPNSGNQLVNLTYTAGADAGDNRIGNPYGSHIIWNNSLGTNVQATIYILQNGNYVAYGNGTDVPSHQGFIAYANAGGGSVTFTEACKSVSTTSSWGRVGEAFDLSMKISSPELTDYYQENSLSFNENATNAFDVDLDHRFIKSPEETAPSICMVASDGKRVTRNAFAPSKNETMTIPIKMTVGVDGKYTLGTNGANSITAYSCVILEDLQAHKMIDLKEQPDYSFQAKVSDSPDRFILHLTRKSTSCEKLMTGVKPADAFFTDNQVTIYSNDGSALIKFDLDEASNALISVYDLQGRSIISEMSVTAFRETMKLDLHAEATGLYLVNVNLAGNHLVAKKIFVSKKD